jgi:hypothetical protein
MRTPSHLCPGQLSRACLNSVESADAVSIGSGSIAIELNDRETDDVRRPSSLVAM